MKFIHRAALVLTVLCLSAGALAQSAISVADPASIGFSTERLAQIGAWYQKQIDAGALPGAVVAIARDGKLAYMRAVGYQDRARTVPMRPDAIFWIASMTKPVTSVAAMMLVEEGKLDLDASVSRYLPDLKDMQVATEETDPLTGEATTALAPQKHAMTVRDLLRHTSGLIYPPQFISTSIHRLYGEKVVFTRNTTLADFVASLGKVPLAHQPGEVWEYSWGVDVLARVVEVGSGQPFDQFLQGRIFGPLHMIDTGFYVPESKLSRLVDPPPGGRDALWDVTKPPRLFSGGGGLVSTAADYLRFCQMLLSGGELDGVRILTPETLQLMTTNSLPADIRFAMDWIGPQAGASWGLGFEVRTNPGFSNVPGAVGSFTWSGLWGTYFWIDPVEKLITVQMIQVAPDDNIGQYFRALRFLTYAALRSPERAFLTSPSAHVTVSQDRLATYAGTYDFGLSVSPSDKRTPDPTYIGTGIEIDMRDGPLKVRASYPNGPAFRAGVMVGDIITHLDDRPVSGLNLNQARSRLLGPVGAPVRLGVMHPGLNSAVDVTVVREAPGSDLVGMGGIEVVMRDALRVLTSYPNGSAAKVGVMVGDIITHVDDTPVTGMSVAELQRRSRGPVGTPVHLKILHAGQNDPVDVTVLRERIVGLGMEIALQDGGLRVRAQYPNWPAAKAGVMAGDIITHVDDTPIRGLNLAEVQGKLRGPVGTSVRLKIVHAGQDNPVNVTVVRELVAGIGMEIAMQDDVLTVRASSSNGAAAKAGLAAGDIITSVDDIPINGLNIAQLTAKFRGEVDTPVRLRILHPGQDIPVDVTVIRKMIKIQSSQLAARMEDGRLLIEATGPFPVLDFDVDKPVAVQAISDREFYYDGGDRTRIAFITDQSGKVTGAILNPGSREIKGVKVE
jgi:CubicO group peptidase (beta-lactamase class C family)/C-terminal processing protease CtpA/Prc